MRRVIFLRETWSHMAQVSGFDPFFISLQDHFGSDSLSFFVPYGNPSPGIFRRGISKIVTSLQSKPKTESFGSVESRHLKVAGECLKMLTKYPEDLLVLSSGENQLSPALASAPAQVKKRIYLCLHQPPAWYRLFWRNRSTLSGFGGIISLSAQQTQYFKEVFHSPVYEIRHGVNLDFFQSDLSRDELPVRLLFVGQWLRDFRTLSRSIPLILEKFPETGFDVVVPHFARKDANLYPIARIPQVKWHADISPEDLRTLYQRSRALFLPLLDSTANNAILEAMACSLPVVTTDVGGTRDYLSDSAGFLCRADDPVSHASAAMALIADSEKGRIMGKSARVFAEKKYNWMESVKIITRILAQK